LSERLELFSPAPVGSRILAYLVDQTLIATGVAFANSLFITFGVHVPGSLLILNLVISTAYFISMAYFLEYSIGKKLLNLRLISIYDGHKLPLLSLIKRETVGRLVASIGLIGYASILFTSKHRGFHDKIAESIVVSEGPARAIQSKSQVLQSIAFSFGLLLAVIIGAGSYLLYSGEPLKQWARAMALQGLKFDGIEGCLANGFSFKHLTFQNEILELEADSVVFHYSLTQMLQEGSLHIQNLSTASMHFNLKLLANLPDATGAQNSQTLPAENPLKGLAATNINLPFLVDDLYLNDVQILGVSQTGLEFKKLGLHQLKIEPGKVALSQFWIESNLGLAKLKNVELQSSSLLNIGNGEVLLRRALSPKNILQDIDLQFYNLKSNLEQKSFTGQWVGFKNSVSVQGTEKGLEITTKDFQPHWYWTPAPPIYNVSLHVQGPWKDFLTSAQAHGYYSFETQVFNIRKLLDPTAGFLRGDTLVDQRKVSAALGWNAKDEGNPFRMQLLPEIRWSSTDILAQMLFKKSKTDLNAVEAQKVAQELEKNIGESNLPEVRAPASGL
jgi:uncharacterized RDD family membrane protein YckC